MSVCLFAWNYSVSTGQIFMKFDIRGFLENLSRKFKLIKSDKNNGYFIPRTVYICHNISPSSALNEKYRVAQKERMFVKIIVTFFYFQYKRIILTPKQPVINAVSITYIHYSITENYIGKMASFLPYTDRSLSSKFCITFTNICCGTIAISSRMETFRSSTVRGFRT